MELSNTREASSQNAGRGVKFPSLQQETNKRTKFRLEFQIAEQD
jgi:hypothetical protein